MPAAAAQRRAAERRKAPKEAASGKLVYLGAWTLRGRNKKEQRKVLPDMINEEKQDAEKDERQLAKRIEDRQGGECVRYKESRAEKQLVDADPKLGEKE